MIFILELEMGREGSPHLNNYNWEKYYSQERKLILRKRNDLSFCV